MAMTVHVWAVPTIVDFEDRPTAAAVLSGEYPTGSGLNWGASIPEWFTMYDPGFTKFLFVNSTSTAEVTKTFTLPAGKVLKSLKIAGAPTVTTNIVKVSQPGNDEITWTNIPSTYQTYTTGWTTATGNTVTVKITCTDPTYGTSNMAFDDITYDDAVALNTYFGYIHGHTSYSDGMGTPAQAYDAAKAIGLDYLRITDHHGITGYITDANWTQTKADAAAKTVNGSFVALAGYEWTTNYGHVGIFNTDTLWFGPMLSDLRTWLSGTRIMAIFNHPGEYNSDNFFNYAPMDNFVAQELWNYNGTYYYTGDGYVPGSGVNFYNEALTVSGDYFLSQG